MSIERAASGAVATITLNRPEKLNAFSGTMREDLVAALRATESDDAIRAVIITGAGRAFCAGGDVEFMSRLQETNDTTTFRGLLDAGRDIVLEIASMTKPVIAAVNGVAAGAGCNLALACDYRIVSDAAKFSESFVKIALHPDWGGTWLLPRLVGKARALELLLTGRMVDASEALAIGLADRVVPATDLEKETATLAATFAAAPPIAARGIKRALTLSGENTLREQLDLEAEHQLACFLSDEARTRIAAFARKA
jgi:2-(1,2-epoxy-1,2-dihydrophenyl)acetyl-CoA isomerase